MVKPPNIRIVRGYARHKKDEARLKAGGVKTIYRADDGEKLQTIRFLGDEDLIVVDGFRALGRDAKEITDAVDFVHARGARIVDLATQLNSRDHGHKLMGMALERRVPGAAHTAMMRAAKEQPHRTHKREALAIWRKPELSVIEKLKLLEPWGYTRYWLYSDEGIREGFGKTGNAGRIPNALKKQE